MAKTRQRPRTGRRHPLAAALLVAVGLSLTGGVYAVASTALPAPESTAVHSAEDIAEGGKLFAANCASCHGLDAAGSDSGPSLIGVGALAVDFQVGTGRMPMQADGPQAVRKPVQFSQAQIDKLAAYVASLAPGPEIPSDEYFDISNVSDEDLAKGAELFRINCAMCHNVNYAGGALTQGKFAPTLIGVSEKHIYAAMVIGPQNMPVFNNTNITPEEKRNIIAAVKWAETNPSPGGIDLGGLGPVSEGLFIWLVGLLGVVGITVWMTSRAN